MNEDLSNTNNSAQAVTDGEMVIATVDVDGSVLEVFRALLTSEVERWWGSSDTYKMLNWQADLRIGGRWSVDVRLTNGKILPAGGEFLEVELPRKVVQTRRYDWDHPSLGRTLTKLTYLFDNLETGTQIHVRHEGFTNAEAAREHADGWEQVLNLLAAHLRRK